jgi:transcriptional regulator with XRE-family HTH domain
MSKPDEVSPRKPQDPPWRSRTAHRSLDPAAAKALLRARRRLGWNKSEASLRTGVSRRMILALERAERRPSVTLAEALVAGYGMQPGDAAIVRAQALPFVGRDSPYRSEGWRPSPDAYKKQEDRQMLGPRRTAPAPQDAPEPPEPAAWGDAYNRAPDGEEDPGNPWADVYAPDRDAVRRRQLAALRAASRGQAR